MFQKHTDNDTFETRTIALYLIEFPAGAWHPNVCYMARFVKLNTELHLNDYNCYSIYTRKIKEKKTPKGRDLLFFRLFVLQFTNWIDKIHCWARPVQMNHRHCFSHVTHTHTRLGLTTQELHSRSKIDCFFFGAVTKKSPIMLEFIYKWPTYNAWLNKRTI